jgi:hypothetical protein
MLSSKVDSIAHILGRIEEAKCRINAEILERKDAIDALDRSTRSLEERIKVAIHLRGGQPLVGNSYEFSSWMPAPSLVIEDESLIPAIYKEVRQEIVVKKNDIKAALKEGVDVAGVSLKRSVALKRKVKRL